MLRHRQGGARIYDSSEACGSFVDRTSELRENTSVWNSRLESVLAVDSTLVNISAVNSFIAHTFATNAFIADCPIIACELIAGGTILRSEVTGVSRISGGVIEDSRIKDLTFTGGHLLGIDFDGQQGYVSRGLWTRPPRILKFDGLTITESVVDENGLNVFCGCFEFPVSHWFKCGDRYGKTLGLSKTEVAEIRRVLHSWCSHSVAVG